MVCSFFLDENFMEVPTSVDKLIKYFLRNREKYRNDDIAYGNKQES